MTKNTFDTATRQINVSTLRDAETAFFNSGWIDRFEADETAAAAAFIRRHCSADRIDETEFDHLLGRFAVEARGWSASDI
jgi:hypothetical protein